MTAKVVISDANYGARSSEIIGLVHKPVNCVVVSPNDREKLLVELRDADIFISSRFDKDMADAARKLRLLQCSASGTDSIDRSAIPENVALCNTCHHEQSIAEHVIMMMLALSRDLLGADRDIRDGHWRSVIFEEAFQPHRLLAGKTIGIIGFGHIGQKIALLAKAFSMRVIAVRRDITNPSPYADEIRHASEINWLMESADFAVVAAPLSEETRSRVGTAELAALGPDSFLINVGRGPIVDEDALYDALKRGIIRGAAIDVWYLYPQSKGSLQQPSRHDFSALNNIIMTPHHSGQAMENFNSRIEDFAFNINATLQGTILRNRLG